MYFYRLVTYLFSWYYVAFCLPTGCSNPLGIEWHEISDTQFTASDSQTSAKTPDRARLNHMGCWRTTDQYDNQRFWQVDLTSAMRISGLVLQGSPYNLFALWVKTFRVQYRVSEVGMVYITDSNGNNKVGLHCNQTRVSRKSVTTCYWFQIISYFKHT